MKKERKKKIGSHILVNVVFLYRTSFSKSNKILLFCLPLFFPLRFEPQSSRFPRRAKACTSTLTKRLPGTDSTRALAQPASCPPLTDSRPRILVLRDSNLAAAERLVWSKVISFTLFHVRGCVFACLVSIFEATGFCRCLKVLFAWLGSLWCVCLVCCTQCFSFSH